MTDEPKKTEEVELTAEQLEEAAGGADGSVRIETPGPTNTLIGLLLPAVQKVC